MKGLSHCVPVTPLTGREQIRNSTVTICNIMELWLRKQTESIIQSLYARARIVMCSSELCRFPTIPQLHEALILILTPLNV